MENVFSRVPATPLLAIYDTILAIVQGNAYTDARRKPGFYSRDALGN